MASVTLIVSFITSLLFCTHIHTVFGEHSFLPAPEVKQAADGKTPRESTGPSFMGMGMTVHQQDKKKPICPQFFLPYAKVRKATFFLRRKLAFSERRFKQCKSCILCDTDCETPYKQALVFQATACIKLHGFAACAVGVSLLGRDADISYTCRFYFKESRIGNCYALEYLTLNGLTKNGQLILAREKGFYNKKQFQCRAGWRARLPNLKNQDACRTKFRVNVAQIEAVSRCASPAFTQAINVHSACTINAPDIFAINQCYINWIYQSNLAYINCIVPHGVPAVAVASLAIGRNALSCPVLRRDSYVGACKAPDFVNLVSLGEVEIKARYIKVLLSGACNYKK